MSDVNSQLEAQATSQVEQQHAPVNQPEQPTQRQFSPDVISKLNAIGVDPNDSKALKDLGFEMDSTPQEPSTAQQTPEQMRAAQMADNNSPDYLGAQQDPNESKGDNTPNPSSEEGGDSDGESKYVIDHPMFGGKKDFGVKDPSNNEVKPVVNEDINKIISEKFKDQGISSFDDLLSNYEKANTQLQELDVFRQEYEKIENSFKSMPPELLKAISLAEQGQDWKSFISSSPNIDFSKSADELNKEDLVKTYFGDKFSPEDFEAANEDSEDFDPNIKRMVDLAYEQAKDKFIADKSKNTLTLEQARQQQEERQKLLSSSASKSLNSIKEFMPDVPNEYLENIGRNLLENKIDSLFSNPDGSYKEDAGLRLAFAMDGPELIQQMQKVITEQAQTEANLRMLLRKQDKPTETTVGNTNPSSDEIRPEVKEYIARLTGNKL